MHGQVRLSFEHRRFELLHEQALAADFGKRLIKNLIALGGHAENLDVHFRVTIAQQCLHVQSLPHCQGAFARRDHAAFQFGHSVFFQAKGGRSTLWLRPLKSIRSARILTKLLFALA